MASILIGYDLHPKAGETYGELIEAIKKTSPDWWHCLDSTWIIKTDLNCVQVRERLARFLKNDDQLITIDISGREAAWQGFNKECADWLRNNL